MKSNGLKLVQNDSLLFEIISLYDFYYEILEKIEENYSEKQFYPNHYSAINTLFSDNMLFDSKGGLIEIIQPIALSKKEKNSFLNRLMNIGKNREYILKQYFEI